MSNKIEKATTANENKNTEKGNETMSKPTIDLNNAKPLFAKKDVDNTASETKEEKVFADSPLNNSIKIDLGDASQGIPSREVTTSGPLESFLKTHPYLSAIELLASKKDLGDYIDRQISLKSDVRYVNLSSNQFRKFLDGMAKGEELSTLDIQRMLKVFFPVVTGAEQPLNGFFEVRIRKDELFPQQTPEDIFEYSSMEDPQVIYDSPIMKKFEIDGVRMCYYINVETQTVFYFIPALTVILSFLGLDTNKILKDNYNVTLGEVTEHITVRIRKEIQ